MIGKHTPAELLERLGACDEWIENVSGLTWRQAFDFVWRKDARQKPNENSGQLGWLASHLGGRWSYASLCCTGCNPDLYACLFGLPFAAWIDAVEAYFLSGEPKHER